MSQDKVWIIQKCINASKNEYQDWPGYCEETMTRKKMVFALKECNEKWPACEFRGHNTSADPKKD